MKYEPTVINNCHKQNDYYMDHNGTWLYYTFFFFIFPAGKKQKNMQTLAAARTHKTFV